MSELELPKKTRKPSEYYGFILAPDGRVVETVGPVARRDSVKPVLDAAVLSDPQLEGLNQEVIRVAAKFKRVVEEVTVTKDFLI